MKTLVFCVKEKQPRHKKYLCLNKYIYVHIYVYMYGNMFVPYMYICMFMFPIEELIILYYYYYKT